MLAVWLHRLTDNLSGETGRRKGRAGLELLVGLGLREQRKMARDGRDLCQQKPRS